MAWIALSCKTGTAGSRQGKRVDLGKMSSSDAKQAANIDVKEKWAKTRPLWNPRVQQELTREVHISSNTLRARRHI